MPHPDPGSEQDGVRSHEGDLGDLPLLDDVADDGAPLPATEEPSGTNLLALWSDRPEAEAIPELLRPEEAIVCVGSGTIVRSGRLSQPRWLVVLTDRRVLCIRGAVAATRRIIDMPVGAIRSAARKGLFRSTLTLDTGYGTLRIGSLKKPFASELLDGLQALMRVQTGDAAAAAIPRARLPEAPAAASPDGSTDAQPALVAEIVAEAAAVTAETAAQVARLHGTVAELRAEVKALRARLAAIELASDRTSV